MDEFKKTNLRFKVILLNYVIAATLVLGFGFMFFAFADFFGFIISKKADSVRNFLLFSFGCLTLGYILTWVKESLKYFACPYEDCDNSVKIYYKWLCGKCKNVQKWEHSVAEPCNHCGGEQETFYCEHCRREFEL